MKKAILLLLLLVLVPVAIARSAEVELGRGESYFIDGRNITLLELDTSDDKVVLCVNNKKEIISDNGYVHGIDIDLKWVRAEKARFELKYSLCEGCDFGNWDNLDCFNECNLDGDCDDLSENTLDECNGRPRRCVNTEFKKEEPKEEDKKEEVKIEENKTEENKTKEIIKEAELEFKSFTQWVYGLFLRIFK